MTNDRYVAFRQWVEHSYDKLLKINEDQLDHLTSPPTWNSKEILGHLIDSAINNHRRIILYLGEGNLIFDGYDQDHWVKSNAYSSSQWPDLVHHWYLMNMQLLKVIDKVDDEALFRKHKMHNLDSILFRPIPSTETADLDNLISDYHIHLRHHLQQIWDRIDQKPENL